jgi:hypothetical protein
MQLLGSRSSMLAACSCLAFGCALLLSLVFPPCLSLYTACSVHPCPLQNPDPKAAAYFAAYISKAYAALTDDVSRQNYEKYGHPDGPQVGAI